VISKVPISTCHSLTRVKILSYKLNTISRNDDLNLASIEFRSDSLFFYKSSVVNHNCE